MGDSHERLYCDTVLAFNAESPVLLEEVSRSETLPVHKAGSKYAQPVVPFRSQKMIRTKWERRSVRWLSRDAKHQDGTRDGDTRLSREMER
jgi:hypothetical protein